MARRVRQDIAGYNVGIASLGNEYTRVLESTVVSKQEREAALDQVQSLMDLYRRIQRKLLTDARKEGFRAPQQQRASRARASAERESEVLVPSRKASASKPARTVAAR